MKPKAFLFALFASVLFVLLVAACGDGGDNGDIVAESPSDGSAVITDESGSANSPNCRFGGPYPKKGTSVAQKKIEDFRLYSSRGFTYSQATELEESKLIASITHNLESPYGVRFQLYNYVITAVDCEFLVATWTDDKSELSTEEKTCLADKFRIPLGNQAGMMINFFPEDLGRQLRTVNEEARRSPCWIRPIDKRGLLNRWSFLGLSSDAKIEKNGLLDALSKHFMLAQGLVRGENNSIIGTSIADFPANNPSGESAWATKQVAYAGEILVDLTSCTYSLNSGSGTYKPFDKFMAKVTELFASEINNGSLKISGIDPWCPSN